MAAFAETHGVSKQAAAKWKARGLLVFQGDKVEVEKSDRKLRDAGAGRFKPDAGAVDQAVDLQVNRSTDRLEEQPHGGALRRTAVDLDDVDDDELDAFVDDMLAGRFGTIVQAQRVKENALAMKHLLEARRISGQLVDVEVAERVLFDCARAARDAWLNFPSKVGPLLSADTGVDTDQIVEALTAHVQRQLEELGEPTADFSGAEAAT